LPAVCLSRPAAEIDVGADGADVLAGHARVRTQDGTDVTENYVRGAEKARTAARNAGARLAILKARSPSCGCARIYDGTFGGVVTDGDGVTAAMLKQDGLVVVDDEQVS